MSQLYVEKFVKDDKCNWLVFLHGFGGSTKMWKHQIDDFKDKFNLLFIDLPGHGKSLEGIADKKIEKFANDFAGYLLMPTDELRLVCEQYKNKDG